MTQILLNIDNQKAKKFNALIEFFGDNEKFVDSVLDYNKNLFELELKKIQSDLEKFENKYQMSSDKFYKKFESGKLDDSKDFIIWSGIYDLKISRLKKLEAIQ